MPAAHNAVLHKACSKCQHVLFRMFHPRTG